MNGRLRTTTALAATAIAIAAFAVGWRYYDAIVLRAAPQDQASNTAVLGSNGQQRKAPERAVAPSFPAPPAPNGSEVDIAPLPSGAALAVWPQGGQVHGARFTPAAGWSAAQPLETIRGEVNDLELAGNDKGDAMAVWRHTLGDIQSLRFSRWTPDAGWAPPDVIPGVLPRRLNSGVRPRLMMDTAGGVTLQWPSGFGGTSAQVTRYETGRGWSVPLDVAAR